MKNIFQTLYAISSRKSLKSYVRASISLLENFSNQRLITQGCVLHAHLIKMGLASQKYVAVKLLIMYLNSRKSFEIDQMTKEFDGFNLVANNCLVNAYLEWGNHYEACRLFDEMPERNVVSWTALVSGLLKCGRVEQAMRYFERNPFQNVFSWTAMISGLVHNGLSFKAMKFFREMRRSGDMPNCITFTSVVRACGDLRDFELGKSVLGLIVKVGFEENTSVLNSLITFNLRMGEIDLAKTIFDRMEDRDVITWTAILDIYVELGDLAEARRIFDEMPERNEVSWSAMIARYSQSGYAEDAVSLFSQMVQCGYKPNISCYSSLISALASLENLLAGKNIHAHVLKIGIHYDAFIVSSLIDLYCKCGNTKDGGIVFDSALDKNVVCWNSMVSGYSLNGQLKEALELFHQMPNRNTVSWNSLLAGYQESEQYDKVLEVFNDMISSGEQPNKSTFSSVLCACASLASLEKGNYIHAKAVKIGFYHDIYLGTALIDMYAKSGDIESCRKIFNRMPKKNEIAWTAMIQGLAQNGFAQESLALFDNMEKTSSVAPNELMFSAVLFACSHCGLVDKGLCYFRSMEKVYGVMPGQRHYTIVVDMLARSGRLSEAEEFITNMPFGPEVNAWAALLSGCKTHRDEEMAERIAKRLTEMAEKKSGGYAMLSNIYASSGRWHDVSITRKLMEGKRAEKSHGCSWIEVKN